MKLVAGLLLFAVASVAPDIRYFRNERPLSTPQAPAQTCLVLDPDIFAHAAPQLSDLRLYRGRTETPYVIYMPAPLQSADQSIAPLNLGSTSGQTVFDAAMPDGSYSDLQLAVTGHDFIATVTVSGGQAEGAAKTKLGSYTIFDLTHQRLGRSTVLHLPQSDFRYLHFSIAGPISPESVTGISVSRLPASHPKYVTVAESSSITVRGRTSVIELNVPAHVPIDQIVFTPAAEPASFSRGVSIAESSVSAQRGPDATAPPPPGMFYGSLLRVHRAQSGYRIDEERLAIDAHGVDFNTPAKWTITIENGDDVPLKPQSVRLQMLQRSLCFDAATSAHYALYYGDPALTAPRYDYASLFAAQADASTAVAGQEQPNPEYQPRPDERPFTEKHPALLWIALALVVALLATIALRSAKLTTPAPPPV